MVDGSDGDAEAGGRPYQKWFAQVVSADDTNKFLGQFGGDPLVLTPADAQAKMLKDITDWNAQREARQDRAARLTLIV